MILKQKRQELNLSQTELAKKIKISQKSVSNYEKGVSDPDIETLIKLADFFHITVDNLIEHKVTYLLDTSIFTEAQKEVINLITELSNKNCNRVKDFITGILIAENEREQTIQKLKGE